jgi:hypothetical protein
VAKPPKSRRVLSRTGAPPRAEKAGTANRAADVSIEQEIKRLLLEGQALTRPGHYDPQKAMRVKLELDGLMLNMQHANQAAEAEYFGWLESNIPEMFRNTGRPDWIESEKVQEQDKALLKEFEDTLARNVATTGKKHRASQKTYSDLADKYGEEDEETVKQRVMRARRRQKAFKESTQDILSIAAQAEAARGKVIAPKEREERREKLLEAFRRLLRKE